MTNKLITIAKYLKTRTEGKKHGSYLVYQDERIEISYDTYYPNVEVSVFHKGEWKLAVLHNGGGFDQEYHSGEWEKYVLEVLYPKAVEEKKEYLKKKEERAAQAHRRRFGDL